MIMTYSHGLPRRFLSPQGKNADKQYVRDDECEPWAAEVGNHVRKGDAD
jgi:hypothetical protein